MQSRLHFIFQEFQNIFVSFSGGKDSGLLLNLVLDFRKKYYPNRRIGVFHQDFEAQYSVTTEYIERTFARIEKEVEPYWVCLPMATRTALSNYEMYWYPWDDEKEEAWVRPMPKHPYVINLRNNPITTYRYKMHQEDLARQFCGGTACAMGIKRPCAFWVFGPMNPSSATGAFLTGNAATKTPAGSAANSKCVDRISHVRLDHQRCVARQCCVSL